MNICEEFDLNSFTALKIASALGGGLGLTNQTCWAVLGAVMVIGLKYRRTKHRDSYPYGKPNALV